MVDQFLGCSLFALLEDETDHFSELVDTQRVAGPYPVLDVIICDHFLTEPVLNQFRIVPIRSFVEPKVGINIVDRVLINESVKFFDPAKLIEK